MAYSAADIFRMYSRKNMNMIKESYCECKGTMHPQCLGCRIIAGDGHITIELEDNGLCPACNKRRTRIKEIGLKNNDTKKKQKKNKDIEYKCLRPLCLYRWSPNLVKEKPSVCPNCKSPYWDIPIKKMRGKRI